MEAANPTTDKTSCAQEQGSYGSRKQSGLSVDSFLTSVKTVTVAKLQQRAGLTVIIVWVTIVWSLLVLFIISYAVSRVSQQVTCISFVSPPMVSSPSRARIAYCKSGLDPRL